MVDLRGKTLNGFRVLEQVRDRDAARRQTFCKAICDAENPNVPVASGQLVALRIFESSGGSGAQFEWLKARVARLAKLNGHPNIVRHYGCFGCQIDERNYHVVVQEYLDGDIQNGRTLKEQLSKLRIGLDVTEGLRIVGEVADALAHAVKFKVSHFDIRPENIFICKDGTAKVINFGMEMAASDSVDGKGCLHGSFKYAAPDFMCSGFCGDEQSDIFSLGVVFHQIVSGKLPYISELKSGEEGWRSRWQEWSNGAENADSPVFVHAIVMRLLNGAYDVLEKALDANRANRYASFEAMRQDLAKITFCEQRHGDNTYRWLQRVGKGGFGEVFKALWVEANRFVAVKRLLNIEFAERFRREAKVMQKLQGPGFVQFIDFFETSDQAFLVMQFLDGMPGSSLRDAIRVAKDSGKVLSKTLVLAAFERYARGLSLMHGRKIFHRDIKPSNLYYPMERPDQVAIMDFGIVKVEGALATMTGEVLTSGMAPCTPDYAPAEIIEKRDHGGPGMDIFALGLCMYEALTGRHGYERLPEGIAGMTKLVDRCKSKQKPTFDDPRVRKDPELLKLLRDMTNPDLSHRLKKADEVAARIRRLFYREVSRRHSDEGETMPTVVFDPATVTNMTLPIDEKCLLEYYRECGRRELDDPILDTNRGGGRFKSGFRLATTFIVGVAVLGGILAFACPWAKRAYAERELEGVLEAYRKLASDAADKENAWIVEFNPQSYSWLRLDPKLYASCTNAIYAVKRQSRADKLSGDCLSRLGNCLSNDGKLKLEAYAELNEWTLPSELDGDDRVAAKLSEIGRSVTAELKECVAIDNIKNRRHRLKVAKDILENRWTSKVVDDDELRQMKNAVADADALCVGSVRNGCKDAITVCGEKIAHNETRTIIVRDGRPERQLVTREGYKPIPLPTGFDGMAFEVDDSSFIIKPIKFAIPKFGKGLRFFMKDREYASGEEVELNPGIYIARYVRDDTMPTGEKMYKDYLVEFSVTANADMKIPGPGNWEYTDEYLSSPVVVEIPNLNEGELCRIDGAEKTGKVKIAPGKHRCVYEKKDYHSQTNSFDVAPGQEMSLPKPRTWQPTEGLKKLRDAVELAEQKSWAAVEKTVQEVTVVAPENVKKLKSLRDGVSAWRRQEEDRVRREKEDAARRLATERKEINDELVKLLAHEPISGRRKRLDAAKRLLQGGKARRVLAEDEVQEWDEAIRKAERLVVGRIKNDCDFPIVVSQTAIAPGKSCLISYNEGQSQGAVIKAKGYENQVVARELDGAELVIAKNRWTMSDVTVKILGAANGVSCFFKGGHVKEEFRTKPGNYSLVFKRDGYEPQSVSFVAKLCEGCVVEAPRDWTPLPVEVSVLDLERGVRCYLGSNEISGSVRLPPGKLYDFCYQKDDCVDQHITVRVEPGAPVVVPGPSVWKEVADVGRLSDAERYFLTGKLESAASLVKGVNLKSASNLERLRVLKGKIERAIAQKESVELAKGAFLQDDWHECVRYYHVACANGCALTAKDLTNVEAAYSNSMEELKAMLKKTLHDIDVGRTPIRAPDVIRKDMRQLNEWRGEIRKMAQSQS